MYREKNHLKKQRDRIRSKAFSSAASSDYNTCSDNDVESMSLKRQSLNESLQSVILAGQIQPCCKEETISEESLAMNLPNTYISNDTNYSINVLDQNLDVFKECSDTFLDCEDLSQTHLNEDDSTQYLQLESLSNMKSSNHFYTNYLNLNRLSSKGEICNSNDTSFDPTQSQIENERLITIMEETEVTNSIKISKSPKNSKYNSEGVDIKISSQLKTSDKTRHANKHSMKRVLFANKNNQGHKKFNNLKLKKPDQCSNLPVSKVGCYVQKERDINENCNNHNTTESFVLWEKACKISDKLVNRRSRSFSEISFTPENYTGDDEYSTSFKTLDDTFIFDLTSDSKNFSHKKSFKQKSKSCDSLLREVKHLPHMLYDRFLKCLAKEIETIRRQNIICTCPKLKEKISNKENNGKSLKYNTITPIIKISNAKVNEKTKFPYKMSPVKLVTNTNQNKISPEILKKKSTNKTSTALLTKCNKNKLSPEIVKDLSQDTHKLSPKSINKTPTTPSKKRGLYSWQKEIVSPVGEYIRGKRQSPFKTSPNKKKL